MLYERSERRSTFLIGYCVSRLNHFVDRIFTQFDTSQDVIREVRNHLLLAEENVFMLARANERALVIEMTDMINTLAELCDGTSELGTGREAILTLGRHRATVLADKIETLGSIAVSPDGDMRAIYEFAAALAWYVSIAEADATEDVTLAWEEVRAQLQRLPPVEQQNANEIFRVASHDGSSMWKHVERRIWQFGVRLHNLDSGLDEGGKVATEEVSQAPEEYGSDLDREGSKRVYSNIERNSFMYELYMKGTPLKTIMMLVRKRQDWAHFTGVQGVHKAIRKHAKDHKLDQIYRQARARS